MKTAVLEDKKNRIVFEVDGATNTVAGLVKKELWNDKHVKAAGYNIAHPLINIPRFVVDTDGAEPRKTVVAAIKRVEKQLDKLRDGAKTFR